jgi:DNA-binding NarL/FixJ family response regulator
MNDEATLSKAPMAPVADTASGRRTIVIVDDHPVFRQMLSTALNTTSDLHCVATAASAAEGESLTNQWRPDIVIMDIQMPGQDGLATTRRIREASPETMVAVVSAHGEREWVARAADAGASAFIAKNGSLPDMVQMLRQIRSTDSVVVPAEDVDEPSEPVARTGAAPVLTDLERRALTFMGGGLRGRDLARTLGVGLFASGRVVRSLHRKLITRDDGDLVSRGRQLGLINTV